MNDSTSVDLYVHKELLAWVYYPYAGSSCYVYPQYLYHDNTFESIDRSAFPNNGCFQGGVAGGATPSDLKEKYGGTVVAVINADVFDENYAYDPEEELSSKFRSVINPYFSKGASDLELTRFSNHPFSSNLIQIVEIQENVLFEKPLADSVHIDNNAEILCQMILVERTIQNESYYFGPFRPINKASGEITLEAIDSKDYRIARINKASIKDLLTLKDRDDNTVNVFIESALFDAVFSSIDDSKLIDWIPEKVLIEALNQSISLSDDFSSFSKGTVRNIKTALRAFRDSSKDIVLDDNRVTRLNGILSDIDVILDLPESTKNSLADSLSQKDLASLVLNEDNYPRIKDRLLESAGIKEQIQIEKQNLETELNHLKEKTEEAHNETEEALKEAEEAKEQLEMLQTQALEGKRDELKSLEKDIETKTAEYENIKDEYERSIVQKDKIQHSINEIFDGINDEIATSGKILESEILRKVVATVSGARLGNDEFPASGPYESLREDDASASDRDVIDSLYDSISVRAGRSCSRNDVINYMTCITQGFITTFAGMPGSGKTSLCNILAGALGLFNDSSEKRFIELSVENGWTSYKDYVGYYNPLSKAYEKSNPLVFDAMQILSREKDAPGERPPFLFLLDEANLSPVEHYWAPFLRACDTFLTNGVPLSLGGSEVLHLPCNVRFLATVNFDHTTEALSQRFLDRSWVITLTSDYVPSESDHSDLGLLFNNEQSFSYKKLLDVFGPKDPNQIDAKIKEKLDSILRICNLSSYPLSHRSQAMIIRYLSTTSKLMDTNAKDTQYAPLDYAVSQKILPMISGSPETVGDFVRELASECTDLTTTKRQLEKMEKLGEDNGFYQYFA